MLILTGLIIASVCQTLLVRQAHYMNLVPSTEVNSTAVSSETSDMTMTVEKDDVSKKEVEAMEPETGGPRAISKNDKLDSAKESNAAFEQKEETQPFIERSSMDKYKDEEGFPMVEHLPFLPWERLSAEDRDCKPPKGIPSYCCAGSVSKGGSVQFRANECQVGMVSEMLGT